MGIVDRHFVLRRFLAKEPALPVLCIEAREVITGTYLDIVINQSETESTECKRSLSELREIVETVAAFATCVGGTVRVGIDPRGNSVGVQIGSGTLEQLANSIKLNTDPPQYPSITFERDEAFGCHCHSRGRKPHQAGHGIPPPGEACAVRYSD